MEENKKNKEIDIFAKKYIQEIKEESPSKDFTTSLMNAIILENSKSVTVSKALISKKAWFVILSIVFALVLIPFKSQKKSLFTIPELDFSFFNKIQVPNILENFSVSSTVLYAVFLFGLMLIAQVFFLKNHLNKRFE